MAARSACSETSTEPGLTHEHRLRTAHRVRLRRSGPGGPLLDGSTQVAPGLDGDARRTRIDAEADRLIALGATVTERFDTSEDIHLILQDPEGNEFCLA
jgi:Glyoxalase-like domain